MLKIFKITLFLAAFASFPALNYGATALAKPVEQPLANYLTVTAATPSTRLLNWELNGSGGLYTVSVMNLTTGSLEQQFNTSNTSAAISGLTGGNTYRYTIQKGTSFIIVNDTNP